MKKIISPLALLGVFVLISFLSYQKLFFHGFTFEEWQNYGEVVFLKNIIPQNFEHTFLDLLLGRRRILGTLFTNYFILNFGNNPFPYAFLGILGHALNGFILYKISKKVFSKRTIAFYSSLFFLTIPVAHEALSYFATSLQTVFSITFYLLSLYFIVFFQESRKKLYLFLSFSFIYISILFKEATVFFAPVILFVILNNFIPKRRRLIYISIFIVALLFIGVIGSVRYWQAYNSLYKMGVFSPITILENIVIYPIITISHFVIPERFILRLGEYYATTRFPSLGWIPPDVYAFIFSSYASDVISLAFSTIIWFFILFSFEHSKQKKLYFFLLLLYWISFIPIAIGQPRRSSAFLERRYYYPVYPAITLLFVVMMKSFHQKFISIKNNNARPIIITGIILFLLLIFFVKNTRVIQRELVDDVVTSSKIRTKVSQIRDAHKTIPENPIFFIENGENLFPNYGTGYMLALIYADSHKIPKSVLLQDNVNSPLYYANEIWKKDFEGYLHHGNEAIGFFYRKASLESFLEKNPNLKDQLVSYRITNQGNIEPL